MKTPKKRYYQSEIKTDSGKTDNAVQDNIEVYNVKITPEFINKQKFKKIRTNQYSQLRPEQYPKTRPGQNPNARSDQRSKKKKYPGKAPIDPKKLELQSRGEGVNGKFVKNPLHALKLKKRENKINYALEQAARSEILLTEDRGYLQVEDHRKTTSITQTLIAKNVDITAATKIFDLKLDFGPYRAKYTRNGRHLLLGGKKGHLAAFDWFSKKLHFEINVMESIHDISWLHIETMLAVAQKDWLYMYDNKGTEIHCIKKMDRILKMEFLPYHFLLAGVNEFGFMTWLDVSIGEIVGHYNNNLGRTTVMTQNPYNATLCLGDAKGVVSLWSPNVKAPLAKILCHKSPVTAAVVDNKGLYMATSGVDCGLKIWDIRNIDGPVQNYKLRSSPLDLEFSQTGMLAVGLGEVVEIYNDCCTQTTHTPYMRHRMAKPINTLKFCPYEDVLGMGTTNGFSSIIIPGSGEPNFDALECNPYQTKRQRKEAEVKALLEKIPAELITLNPSEVAEVDVSSMNEQMEAKKKLLYLKPKKVNVTPRRKNKGQNINKRKKIIKEQAKKEFVNQDIEAKKLLNINKSQAPRQSFGVLDRFVSNPKSKNK